MEWCYTEWLTKDWGYYGFIRKDISFSFRITLFLISIIPSFWIPLSLDRPSKFFYILIYAFMYVPPVFGIGYSLEKENSAIFQFLLSNLAGFYIIGLPYKFSLYSIKSKILSKSLFFNGIFLLTTVLMLWVVIKFGSSMSLVLDLGSSDIYTQRFVASDIMQGSKIGYALTYLAGCLLPLVISYGLFYKKHISLSFGIICYIILFSVGSNKSYILSPFIIVAFFFCFKNKETFISSFFLFLTIISIGLTYSQVSASQYYKVLFFLPSSLFLFRTIMVSAYSSVKYYLFFDEHPLLFYSHIRGFNLFIQYPYDNPVLGQVIGEYYTGNSKYNMNANFWVTDGLSSMWLPGIILVSIFISILFYILDCSADKLNTKYVLSILAYTSVNLTNWNISTVIVSGGLGLLIFLFIFHPKQSKSTTNLLSK